MARTPHENAALVRRFLVDVVIGGDTDAVGAFLAEDVVDHNLVSGSEQRRKAVTALGWRVLAAANIDIESIDIVATDDSVAVRGTVSGVHRESLMDLIRPTRPSKLPPCGFAVSMTDKSLRSGSLPDGLGLMQQLGALPEISSNHSLRQPAEH